ncbi:MAG: 3'(2'),5'-bisphosphate nucleotidase CysQ [Candidatus Moranbacteria bacterium]|jgi:3'(2'), 5'-bisphosphate nucleotidase|nr:3'(2'),5'-bisphosphate nucleotidase CysQ [Candidatus Moranbacteria bacterium]
MHDIEIKNIIKIIKKAGNIAMSFYERDYGIEDKENKTPVTEADLAINEFLFEKLSKFGYPILSEESEDDFEKRKNAEYVWIVDPLDGTSDFIQKTDEFAVMIGLANRDGEAVMGVVYAPSLEELYYAQKGEGSFWEKDGKVVRLKVSDKGIKKGRILLSRNHLGEFEQEVAKKYDMEKISMGSAGLKICRIAKGDAELYINSSDKSGEWDTCAGNIILTEAGGMSSDMEGNDLIYNKENSEHPNGFVIFGQSNNIIYKKILK